MICAERNSNVARTVDRLTLCSHATRRGPLLWLHCTGPQYVLCSTEHGDGYLLRPLLVPQAAQRDLPTGPEFSHLLSDSPLASVSRANIAETGYTALFDRTSQNPYFL